MRVYDAWPPSGTSADRIVMTEAERDALLNIAEAAQEERRLYDAYVSLPTLGDNATPEQEDATDEAYSAFREAEQKLIAALKRVTP